MTVVAHQDELQRLGRLLQEQWLSPQRSLLKIQSTVHQTEVLILAEHKRHQMPDPRDVFEFLEQMVRLHHADQLTGICGAIAATGAESLVVKLYLRVLGQRQPYAVHTFTIDLQPSPTQVPLSPAPVQSSRSPLPPPPKRQRTTHDPILVNPFEPLNSNLAPSAGASGEDLAAQATDQPNWNPFEMSDSLMAELGVSPAATEPAMTEPVANGDPSGLAADLTTLPNPITDNPRAASWGELNELTEVFAGLDMDLHPLDLAVESDAPASNQEEAQSPPSDLNVVFSGDDPFPDTTEPNLTDPDLDTDESIEPDRLESSHDRHDIHDIEDGSDSTPSPLPVLAMGVGVAIASFVGAVYFFSRPCGFGVCPAIPAAQQIQQQVTQQLQTAQSQQDVTEAKAALERAIVKLQDVPFWATAHGTATQLLQTYRQQVTQLDQILQAFQQAIDAANKSQNPPHTTDHWRMVSQTWDGAISKLASIPTDSPAYPLAQVKLKEYQRNLAVIEQRAMWEARSQQLLDQARTAAKQADTQSGTAQTLDSWQLAQTHWQTAVQALSQIPTGTSAFAEAQQLLAAYNQKLTVARNTTGQEQNATKSYNQALNFAQQARAAEQKNQWLQAMNHWRQALMYVKQIPVGTAYYQKAQPLINAYADALSRTEANLGWADAVRQAQLDLRKTCAGSPQICTFTITTEQITIHLTPEYKRSLVATAYLGDPNAQVGVQEHLRTLQAALETISDNANIPISVYDADNSLIGTHKPNPGQTR